MSILEAEHICKTFNHTEVLKDISFSLEKGQALSIIGSSGSGKTTLLRCLNFLETPDKGVIRVNGETLFDADDPSTRQEAAIRKKRLHFGLVFQSFNLFPQYTAIQNVMLAKELLASEQPDYKARKKEILAQQERREAERAEALRREEIEKIRREERARIAEEERIRKEAKREAVEEIKTVDEAAAAPLTEKQSMKVVYVVVGTMEELQEVEMAFNSWGLYYERKDV